MAAEGKLEKYLRKRVKTARGQIRKVKWIGRHGAPDDLVWLPGMIFPILAELKAPLKGPEEHQKREHKRLRKMGFEVLIWNTQEKIDRFFNARK